MPWEHFTIVPLGLHEDENPHALARGELVVASNIARYDNMIGTRPGMQRLAAGQDYDARISEGLAIQGLFEYRRDFDDTRVLVVIADHSSGRRIWFNDTSRYLAGAVTITAGNDNLWNLTEHANLLWGAGGARGDSFWNLDASDTVTPATPAALVLPVSAGAAVFPTYVFSWRGWLLCNGLRPAAGVATAADTNPTVTRYASFGTDPTVAANWAVGNTIGFAAARRGVDSFGSDFSTGFGVYQDNHGDFLLLLGNKTITSVVEDATNDFRVTDHIANGCVAQDAFVSLGLDAGDAVYLSQNGIHSLRQSQEHGARADTFLSWKIRRTFATINRNRMKYIVAGYDHVNGRALFVVPTGSNTFHDTFLVLDTKDTAELTADTARWMIWTLALGAGIVIQKIKFARDSTGAFRWYFATRAGDVLTLSDTIFADFNATAGAGTLAYETALQTNHDAFGSIGRRKTMGDLMLTLSPGGEYQPTYQTIFDYGRQGSARALRMAPAPADLLGTTFVLGTSVLGGGPTIRDEKVYGTGSGRTVSHRISHNGANQPWFLHRLDVDLALSGEDQGDAAA